MRWGGNDSDWHTGFAILPCKVDSNDCWVWLERFQYRQEGLSLVYRTWGSKWEPRGGSK